MDLIGMERCTPIQYLALWIRLTKYFIFTEHQRVVLCTQINGIQVKMQLITMEKMQKYVPVCRQSMGFNIYLIRKEHLFLHK